MVIASTPQPSNVAELRRLVAAQQAQLLEQQRVIRDRDGRIDDHERALARKDQELVGANVLVEKLKFELLRYRRLRFGKKSESLGAEQIALWEAELDADIEALKKRLADIAAARGEGKPKDKDKPRRKMLPATLERVEEYLEPDSTTCGCGQAMVRIGEESGETLQLIPSRFYVKRTIRGKWACRCCQTLTMAPAPSAPIDKAIAGTSVIANVIISKYADHIPLYRQEGIYARMGVAIPRSTQAGWIGHSGVLFEPLTDLLAQHVVARSALQADETHVPVLDPGAGKTTKGYLWAYRTLPSDTVQAVLFDFAMSRAQAHPNRALANFTGTLQVDGYSGYNEVLARAHMIEAGCLAHARRKFVDVFQASASPVAREAITQIAAFYKIEHEFDSEHPAGSIHERQRWRETHTAPLLKIWHEWLRLTHERSPPRSSLAKAIQYSLNRWEALNRFVHDGRLPLDTNAVENCMRPVALGRKNWLYAGSEAGGKRAAQMYTLISSARMNGHEPLAYLTDILDRLPTARRRDLDAMLPWNWQPPEIASLIAQPVRPTDSLIITPN